MKWYQLLLFGLNGLAGLYLLYMATMHFFVYFANTTLGHEESILIPMRNLIPGLIIAGLTIGAWMLLKENPISKTGNILLFIPCMIAMIFGLWTVVILLSANGKWN